MARALKNTGATDLLNTGLYRHYGKIRKKDRFMKLLKTWNQVLVILTDDHLYIYGDECSVKPRAIYDIANFETIKADYSDETFPGFLIKHADESKDTLYFQCELDTVRETWINVLREAKKDKEDRDSGISVSSVSSQRGVTYLTQEDELPPPGYDEIVDQLDEQEEIGGNNYSKVPGQKLRQISSAVAAGAAGGERVQRNGSMKLTPGTLRRARTGLQATSNPGCTAAAVSQSDPVSVDDDQTMVKRPVGGVFDKEPYSGFAIVSGKVTYPTDQLYENRGELEDDSLYENAGLQTAPSCEVPLSTTVAMENRVSTASGKSDEAVYENVHQILSNQLSEEGYLVEGVHTQDSIKQRMKTKAEGTFCIYTNSKNEKVLTVMGKNGCQFILIKSKDDNVFISPECRFSSVNSLVNSFSEKPLGLKSGPVKISRGINDC